MAFPGDMILQTCAFLALALGTLGNNLASVTLNILGDNDYAPEFPSPINSVIVPEGVYSFKKPFLVTKLEAQDLDSKLSGNVSYAVAGVCKNGWGKFHLREFNKLVLITPVKDGDNFVILVEATDHGKPPRRDRCAVVVNVKRSSDGPSIPSDRYTVRLPEGIQTGSHVLTIPVRDNGNGTLQFEIASGNANGDFDIDQEGVIRNVNVLTINHTGEYHLNVTVTETNGSSDNTIVDIKVVQHYLHARNCSCKQDEAPPNRPPTIPSPRYMVHIGEWALINTTIFTIPAVDPDGDNLTYSIVSGNAFKDLEVEPSSGRVINIHSLDYKRKPVYELRVKAMDSRGQSASTRLQIIVIKNTSNSTDDNGPLSDMIMESEKCQCDMLNTAISDHHRNFLVICVLILTQSLWG
ncbi:cadherin EGF LAG seven-pass G-type receptor 1-like [Haliotis rubra]|uniref:cadherin EGF LAG seven-pass G-type receptor 1-like n=1 Tax=Haliotis rubra TaxID=36100 RepID=UPI001EE5C795|nr:cadherin EGF LAG seven-pass G-type receptor 1-like [Haliotis rubra]